ncbi:19701_t:CDS:1, partial [Cetraspora pellucida]
NAISSSIKSVILYLENTEESDNNENVVDLVKVLPKKHKK